MNDLAFDVIHIEPRSSQYWHVAGRALTDICIGDLLEIRLPDKTSMANKGSFVVIAITAYNVSMPKLHYGMGGMLTVVCQEVCKINLARHANFTKLERPNDRIKE
ncbi:hypothetical protein [Herpetosiphon giganteus]|uniref:hypothetical protein n=1 Tax=Herpetosiphon giganteus TaxID=2029754 RepID=UPI00195820AD|nr:hypothetical protein [Herpetosiphon giganteus]MBM7846589.1 hypothetical protein [Herpetosiphon giganteus]